MLLGIDLGTTNVKALLVEPDGKTVSSGSQAVRIDYLPDGGVQQDIEDIWSATLQAVGEAVKARDAGKVQAIGVSSQGGAMQLQTPEGISIGPVISWLDLRGAPFDQEITAQLGTGWFAEHTGHGSSALTIGQLLRMRKLGGLPGGFRVGFVGDLIVSRLCGRPAHDATSLSLAMLYNPSLDDADPELLEKLGLSAARLPDLLPANRPAGGLLQGVAERTQLARGIPVSPAIHDQYAAVLACGAVHPGDVMFGAGTAWVLLAVMDKLIPPVIDTAFVCRHPVKGLFGQILSLGNGGSAVSWAMKTLGLSDAETKIDELVRSVRPGSDGLRCRPLFIGGKWSDHTDPPAGGFDGMKLSHTPAHIVRAVLEGLACELARHLRFCTDAGANVRQLLMTGQAAASSVTPQIISNVTGFTVNCLATPQASALGAAVIARSMLEPQKPLAEISAEMAGRSRTIRPDKDHPFYIDLSEQYRQDLHRRSTKHV